MSASSRIDLLCSAASVWMALSSVSRLLEAEKEGTGSRRWKRLEEKEYPLYLDIKCVAYLRTAPLFQFLFFCIQFWPFPWPPSGECLGWRKQSGLSTESSNALGGKEKGKKNFILVLYGSVWPNCLQLVQPFF